MSKSLILFIHGLGGSGLDTWDGFPQLIAADEVLSTHSDVKFFEYPTSLFRLPLSKKAPGIRDLAEGLSSQLEVRYSSYEKVTLVCHSLGGLVARKYLVEQVKGGHPLRVYKLLLFAVPHNGATLGSVGNQISWRHNQLRELSRNSDMLEELNSDWAGQDMSAIAVRYVVGGQDRVVDKHSAISHWGNQDVQIILDADHRSIVKPRKRDDLAFLILRRFVLGPAPVFVSVGGGRSEDQERFVASVYAQLRAIGLDPRTVDDYVATNTQPLTDVANCMEGCYGAVVVAYERTFIMQGQSRRMVPGRQTELKEVTIPTVWNQIEAAIAYNKGLPLLVLVEKGLLDEGMLEPRYDWRVMRVDLNIDLADAPQFQSVFLDWKRTVLERRGDQ